MDKEALPLTGDMYKPCFPTNIPSLLLVNIILKAIYFLSISNL